MYGICIHTSYIVHHTYNITRKLKPRYRGVNAKNQLLALEMIPKIPEIVNNQTNPIQTNVLEFMPMGFVY